MLRFQEILLTFVICIVYAAEANPNRPGCDLVGSSSNSNVMTRGTIMGQSPTTASNLISFDGGVDNRSLKTLGICLNILCHPPFNTLCDEQPRDSWLL